MKRVVEIDRFQNLFYKTDGFPGSQRTLANGAPVANFEQQAIIGCMASCIRHASKSFLHSLKAQEGKKKFPHSCF